MVIVGFPVYGGRAFRSEALNEAAQDGRCSTRSPLSDQLQTRWYSPLATTATART